MTDVSKLKFENGTYNIKDTTARNEINNLDQKIELNTVQLENEINNLDQKIELNTVQLENEITNLETQLDSIAINVKEFGAKGDGVTDDTVSIQEAIDFGVLTKTSVYFPPGVYLISSPLKIYNNFKMVGDSYMRSWIKATQPMESVLIRSSSINNDVNINDFKCENITIDGNHLADYCLNEERLTYFYGCNVRFMKSKLSNIRIGYGWCNDFVNCLFQSSLGNGVTFVSSNNNAVNFTNCKIFANEGAGITGTSIMKLNIQGCVIEKNKVCGLLFDTGGYSININNTYFEENGTTGYTTTNHGGLTIKTDILVNGKVNKQLGTDYPVKNLVVQNCNFVSKNEETYIFLNAVDGALIEGIHTFNNTIPLITIRPHRSTSFFKKVKISNVNFPFEKIINIQTYGTDYQLEGDEFKIDGVSDYNYAHNSTITQVESYFNSTRTDTGIYQGESISRVTSNEVGTTHSFGYNIIDSGLINKWVNVSVKVRTNTPNLRVRLELKNSAGEVQRAETLESKTNWTTLNTSMFLSTNQIKASVSLVSATVGQWVEFTDWKIVELGA